MKIPTLVPIRLGIRSYDIQIHSGSLRHCAELLANSISSDHIVLFTDSVVEALYLQLVADQLKQLARRVDSIVIPAGEASKSVAQCEKLWQKLVELHADRETVVVALGGGVIGDLAGFVAASFARGLTLIQIPTTLLAQVDSSVGGKVGVNLPQAKNMVGAFWQPRAVLIDPHVLSTLDARNYRAGLAEVIKYGVIMDESLFDFLEQSLDAINGRDPEILSRIVAWCCQSKAEIVESDERETTGRRAILNYGHTYGHAIEAVFGYGEYLHGEAISIGMTCAARLALRLGITDAGLFQRQTAWLTAVGLPTICPAERHAELIAAMKHDKKVAGGRLKLMLPTRIGSVEQFAAPADELLAESLRNTFP